MSEKITYYVSYRGVSEHGAYWGCCDITRDQPVRTMDDIHEMADAITKMNGGGTTVIINWQRFEKETP